MRGVRRSVEHETLVKALSVDPHPVLGRTIFPSMRDLLSFAAVLGFETNTRASLPAEFLEIDGRVFANHQATLDLMYLIALASQKAADILREDKEDEVLLIFEEYANGGLSILQSWFRSRPDDPHGDLAILSGLASGGYLEPAGGIAEEPGRVEF